MNATLRNSLFALTVIGTLSLAACKTDEAVDSSAPAAAPAPAMESAPPPADDSATPPATTPSDDSQGQDGTAPTTTP